MFTELRLIWQPLMCYPPPLHPKLIWLPGRQWFQSEIEKFSSTIFLLDSKSIFSTKYWSLKNTERRRERQRRDRDREGDRETEERERNRRERERFYFYRVLKCWKKNFMQNLSNVMHCVIWNKKSLNLYKLMKDNERKSPCYINLIFLLNKQINTLT